MQSGLRWHLVSAVAGGLVVAGTFLVFGVTGRRSTQPIVEQVPLMARPTATTSSQLTPHAIYVRNAGAIVSVRAPGPLSRRRSAGSGFLADKRGDILTSYGLVADAGGATIEFADDVKRHAVVVAQDPDDDIAVLRVNTRGVPPVAPLAPGDSSNVRVGDPVLALGDPLGYARTMTSGIVSALQQQMTDSSGSTIANVIQTDAPVSPGSEGGPLLDADGRVIGITGYAGAISFAVPIDTAEALLERVR
jgi:S1-C subfamily serine protease